MKPTKFITSLMAAALTAGTALAYDFHDPTSVGWKFRYGQTSDGYHDAWAKYKAEGLMPIDIETDVIDGETRYAGVWQQNKDNRGWKSWRNLTNDEFKDRWAEYKDKGYLPIDQDSEVVNGQVLYSLVMVKNKEGLAWKSYRNLSSAEFSQKFQEHKDDYKPIDVDAKEIGGTMYYSIIWIENVNGVAWKLWRDLTPNEYGDKFQLYKDWARVSDIDPYRRNGKLNYAAIWEENQGGRAWAAKREMSLQGFRNSWKKYYDQGLRVTDIEIYPDGDKVLYAAVWRENGCRYDWGGRLNAEQQLLDFVTLNDEAPGVSAAIVCNGTVVFRGGAGFADAGNNIDAHGGSIYRTASIAKAVSGVIGFDMQDAGLIDLDDQTSTIVPGLGSEHDHTVLQLLQNAGCFGDYGDIPGDENDDQTQYDSCQDVLTDKQNGVLASNDAIFGPCNPGDTYKYSTAGYTPAGAAFEIEAGKDFDVILKQRISDPLGLSTLRAETRTDADSSGDLVKLYAVSGGGGYQEIADEDFENTSWKWAGGGMESSPVDLARLGSGLLANAYFPETERDAMWTGTDANSGYGAGWDLSSKTNPSQVSKYGRQQGTLCHIRISVTENISVVAMTNVRYPDTSDIGDLTNQLLEIARIYCDPEPCPTTDLDGDGLSDTWERAHVRVLDVLHGSSDFDGDGETDLAEERADTDPTDPNSALRAWITPKGGKLRLGWTCEPTRHYTVYFCERLEEDTWEVLRGAELMPGATRSGEMSIDITPPTGTQRRFWRVMATVPNSTSP